PAPIPNRSSNLFQFKSFKSLNTIFSGAFVPGRLRHSGYSSFLSPSTIEILLYGNLPCLAKVFKVPTTLQLPTAFAVIFFKYSSYLEGSFFNNSQKKITASSSSKCTYNSGCSCSSMVDSAY